MEAGFRYVSHSQIIFLATKPKNDEAILRQFRRGRFNN